VLLRSLPASSRAALKLSAFSLLRDVQEIVGNAAAVSFADLQAPTRRSARVAQARQHAMYLAHTTFGLSISTIARGWGRHHSTVAHACRLVEEQRDKPAVDKALVRLEEALAARHPTLASRAPHDDL
jgi:chromosomal replication initiation ATPase DnaA